MPLRTRQQRLKGRQRRVIILIIIVVLINNIIIDIIIDTVGMNVRGLRTPAVL